MENISQVYIGVDISKDHLDVCIHPLGRSLKIKNSEADIAKLAQELKSYTVASIGCEATGGYEKLLVKTLQDHSYNVWIIDPRRVKGFIVATGCKSKTDKIDAQKIAQFVAQNPRSFEAIDKSEAEEKVQALVDRKQDLMKFLVAEKTRFKHPSHAFHGANIKKFIALLEREIEKLDIQIQKLLQDDENLHRRASILESIPGIGTSSAAVLLSSLPELGKIGNNQIAALVGLAPFDNASGRYSGKKFIRGGRATPRNALYMCALTTIKHNPVLKAFYDHLIAQQKPFKVAIVAVMRKMIVLANALLRKNELCRV